MYILVFNINNTGKCLNINPVYVKGKRDVLRL